MTRKLFLMAGILLAAVVLLLTRTSWLSDSSAEAPVASPPPRPGVPVTAMVIQPTPLKKEISAAGTVQANESLSLKSERAGKITHIYFKEGSPVGKGDILVQLNDREIRAKIARQKMDIQLSQQVEIRQRKLLKKEAISKQEYDNASHALNTAKADMAILQAQLEQTKVKAPFSGVIGLRYVSVGERVSPDTPIASLYDPDPVKIEFSIPGQYGAQVKKGQKISFTAMSQESSLSGEVYAIAPQIDVDTRTLSLRALADNPKGSLIPGQLVEVTLILSTLDEGIRIPAEAAIHEREGFKVYTVHEGKAKAVDVKTGARGAEYLQITEGLNPQDTLITDGTQNVYPGTPVNVIRLNAHK